MAGQMIGLNLKHGTATNPTFLKILTFRRQHLQNENEFEKSYISNFEQQ